MLQRGDFKPAPGTRNAVKEPNTLPPTFFAKSRSCPVVSASRGPPSAAGMCVKRSAISNSGSSLFRRSVPGVACRSACVAELFTDRAISIRHGNHNRRVEVERSEFARWISPTAITFRIRGICGVPPTLLSATKLMSVPERAEAHVIATASDSS